jgi:hypothetical protein
VLLSTVSFDIHTISVIRETPDSLTFQRTVKNQLTRRIRALITNPIPRLRPPPTIRLTPVSSRTTALRAQVHCNAGLSRSAAVVVAHVMESLRM